MNAEMNTTKGRRNKKRGGNMYPILLFMAYHVFRPKDVTKQKMRGSHEKE